MISWQLLFEVSVECTAPGATFCIVLVLLSYAGNENIQLLTNDKRQILRIELGDWDGNVKYADYDDFKVGSEQSQFELVSIGKYRGNAGQYDTKTDIIHCLSELELWTGIVLILTKAYYINCRSRG